jgi:hypothetical protein
MGRRRWQWRCLARAALGKALGRAAEHGDRLEARRHMRRAADGGTDAAARFRLAAALSSEHSIPAGNRDLSFSALRSFGPITASA